MGHFWYIAKVGTIRQLTDKFRALDFERIKQEALRETVTNVPEFNRQQLRKGEKSDGTLITPKLSNITYALDKERLNGGAPFLTPDLFNTGAFQREITTVITAKTIKTFSLDLKSPALELKYSPLIFGLSKENSTKYAQVVYPVLLAKLKAATVG